MHVDDGGKHSLNPWWVAGFCFVLLVTVVPAIAMYLFDATNMDEAFNYVYAARILDGALPVRDFLVQYGVGHYFIQAALFKLFGQLLSVERSWALVCHIALVSAVYALSARRGVMIAIICGTLASLTVSGLALACYPWLPGIVLALWSIYLVSRQPGVLRALAAGVLTGAVSLFRPELAPVTVACQLVPLVRAKRLLPYLLGVFLGALPAVLYAAGVPAPSTGHGWMAQALLPRLQALCTSHWSSVDSYLYWLIIMGSLFNFAAALIIVWREGLDRAAGYLMLGLLCLFTLPQFLQWPEWSHALEVSCISTGLLPLFLSRLLDHLTKWTARKAAVVSALAVLTLFVFQISLLKVVGGTAMLALGLRTPRFHVISHQGRSLIVSSDLEFDSVSALFKALDGIFPDGCRVFIGPEDLAMLGQSKTYLYFLLPGFKPASYFMQMDYLFTSAGVKAALTASLQKELVNTDALILSSSPLVSPSASPTALAQLCPLITTGFQQVGKYQGYSLWVRKR